MSIKILGGVAKGFKLETPKNFIAKPTLSLLKRKIFDRIQSWEGVHFLDLYAGSGSVGFEALSRGAEKVTFFEIDNKCIQFLKKNKNILCEKYDLDEKKIEIVTHSFQEKYLDPLKNQAFYIDPPFTEQNLYIKSMEILKNSKGSLFIEGDSTKTIDSVQFLYQFKFLNDGLIKIYKKGSHFIIYSVLE